MITYHRTGQRYLRIIILLSFIFIFRLSYSQNDQIIITPNPAYAGTIPIVSSETVVFTLLNIKSSNVTINSLSFTGPNSSEYKIATDPLPASIGGFNEVKIEVLYQPASPGNSEATFEVVTSAGTWKIPLSAFATEVRDGLARFERIPGIESNIDKSKAMQIVQTVNDNFVIIASTQLRERIFRDVYLMKTDKYGKLLWYRVFEYGTMGEEPYDVGAEAGVDVISLSDESIIALASTNTGGPGSISVYLSKWDANGNMIWENTYGGPYDDNPYNIIEDSDGNFLVVGSTNNTNDGSKNIMVIKIAPDGTLLWNKDYGTTGIENGFDIVQIPGQGYMVVGNDQNPTANITFLKIDKDGIKQWSKTLANPKTTEGNTIRLTSDGGFIVSGYTLTDEFGMQGYLVKVNESAEMQWSNSFGENNIDYFKSVVETSEGGYLCAGANNRFWSIEYVYDDVWIVKTDDKGNLLWEKKIGGDKSQYAADIIHKKDGGYAIAGETGSFREKDRIYLIGIDPTGMITGIDYETYDLSNGKISLGQNYPNPFTHSST
ncbi:MAG: hypothetical protein IH594_13370, partial [Bacteroidales bacterium]|nr:hypothetical protein [Bacteroidales bacterium]